MNQNNQRKCWDCQQETNWYLCQKCLKFWLTSLSGGTAILLALLTIILYRRWN